MYHLGVLLDMIDHFLSNPEEIGLILSIVGLCTVARAMHRAFVYLKVTFTMVLLLVIAYYVASLIYIGYYMDIPLD